MNLRDTLDYADDVLLGVPTLAQQLAFLKRNPPPPDGERLPVAQLLPAVDHNLFVPMTQTRDEAWPPTNCPMCLVPVGQPHAASCELVAASSPRRPRLMFGSARALASFLQLERGGALGRAAKADTDDSMERWDG